jgi:hypothetical protein
MRLGTPVLLALLLGGAAAAQAPPAEPSLEQLLAPRGFAAVQLRQNAYDQLEADVLLNGQHALRVQISTSFSKTTFDKEALEKLGLAVEPSSVELSGPGGKKQRLGTLRLESLAFGEVVLGPLTVFSADLSAFVGRGAGEPVEGVIGTDLLSKYQAVLEIQNAKLHLRVR